MNQLSTPAAAVARARQFSTYRTGQCLNFICNVFTAGRGLGVYAPYALHAWEHAQHRHTDRTPPAGVPVYFSAGTSNPYGHVAISLGGGRIRSTDWPTGGPAGTRTRVGDTTIAGLEQGWNRQYLGWAEDFYGVRIPGFPQAPRVGTQLPFKRAWRFGEQGTPVGYIQKALNRRGYHLVVDKQFGPKTRAAVLDFQRKQRITQDAVVGRVTWGRLAVTA